jgi:hypothetical protein
MITSPDNSLLYQVTSDEKKIEVVESGSSAYKAVLSAIFLPFSLHPSKRAAKRLSSLSRRRVKGLAPLHFRQTAENPLKERKTYGSTDWPSSGYEVDKTGLAYQVVFLTPGRRRPILDLDFCITYNGENASFHPTSFFMRNRVRAFPILKKLL